MKDSVKRILKESGEISTNEYGKYFEDLSDKIVFELNNNTLFSDILCKKKQGRQWGEYHFIIAVPFRNNFSSTENAANEIERLVTNIAEMVGCEEWQTYGDFMSSPYPKVGGGISASVKFIKSSKVFKLDVDVPYNAMKGIVDKTYPNVQLYPVDFTEYDDEENDEYFENNVEPQSSRSNDNWWIKKPNEDILKALERESPKDVQRRKDALNKAKSKKRTYWWETEADSRPLHTKGSPNREF